MKTCKNNHQFDGKRCQICYLATLKAWREKNADKQREKLANWRAMNPEYLRGVVRRWRERNPEKLREYAERNKQKRRARRERLEVHTLAWPIARGQKLKELCAVKNGLVGFSFPDYRLEWIETLDEPQKAIQREILRREQSGERSMKLQEVQGILDSFGSA